MSHTTKSTVQCHLDSKKHQVAVETMQKREKARVERRLEAEADALPHKAAMRQPSLQSVVASCNDKNMDTNLSSYKSLKLDEVPGVQEEWNLYRRTVASMGYGVEAVLGLCCFLPRV